MGLRGGKVVRRLLIAPPPSRNKGAPCSNRWTPEMVEPEFNGIGLGIRSVVTDCWCSIGLWDLPTGWSPRGK